MHKSKDELEIRPDPTTGFHGNRECYNLGNGVSRSHRVIMGKTASSRFLECF